MDVMNPSQIIARDDWAQFPAIAAALNAIERATNPTQLSAARDALRKAELRHDVAQGLTDLWNDWEREAALAMGLVG